MIATVSPSLDAVVGEMAGEPAGALGEFGVGDGAVGVAIGDLGPALLGVAAQQLGNGSDQICPQHL